MTPAARDVRARRRPERARPDGSLQILQGNLDLVSAAPFIPVESVGSHWHAVCSLPGEGGFDRLPGGFSMQARTRRIALALFGAIFALILAGAAQAMDRPDAWVTTKVKMALLTSEGVGLSARHINVDTVDGRVTLHGTVATQAEKAKAEQVASQVEGATKVRNLLQVVPAKQEAAVNVTDDQIAERVQTKLKADKALSD